MTSEDVLSPEVVYVKIMLRRKVVASVAGLGYYGIMLERTAQRFWQNIETREDGCWAWLGYTSKAGYGQISVEGRKQYAHRLSWEIHNGPLPAGAHVLHHCDNPPCCRPDHLFVGSHGDNMRDMTCKGRNHGCIVVIRRGEQHPTTTITEDDVRAIRASDERQVDLAVRFGVSQSTISNVLLRRTWAHIV